MNIKSTVYLFSFLFSLFVLEKAHAQVTIGSGNEPAKGALLDLKEKDAPNGDTTSTKGLIFPRVNLVNLTSLSPLLSSADAADATQKTTHRGIIVYNLKVSATDNLTAGLYYWDGSQWIKVSQSNTGPWLLSGNAGINATNNYIGTSDATDLSIRTNGTDRIHVTAAGDVGIKKTPTSTLSVNGSFGASYKEVTATTYTVLPTDYIVSYNGGSSTTPANTTFTMPTVTTSIAGRTYMIKNLTTNSTITLSAGSGSFRRGGTDPTPSTIPLPPGYYALVTANSNTGSPVWDVLSLQDAHTPNTGWLLVGTDMVTVYNTRQALGTAYADVPGTSMTVTVPQATQNQVAVRWDVWGDATATNASGSIRYALRYSGQASSQIASIMMASWATPSSTSTAIRWTSPVAYMVTGLAAGTYTFTLQALRQEESGTISQTPAIDGIQGRAEVYIK